MMPRILLFIGAAVSGLVVCSWLLDMHSANEPRRPSGSSPVFEPRKVGGSKEVRDAQVIAMRMRTTGATTTRLRKTKFGWSEARQGNAFDCTIEVIGDEILVQVGADPVIRYVEGSDPGT